MQLTPLTEDDRFKINEWLKDSTIKYYLVTEKLNPDLDIVSFGIRVNGELVGWANLQNIDYENSKAEFGIAIPDLKHVKLGGFASKQVVEYGFHVLGLHRIYVRPLVSNIKPYPEDIRDKGGFVREGIERQSVKRGDVYEDVAVMSILKEEFERRWGIVPAIPYIMAAAAVSGAHDAHEARKDAKEQQKKIESNQASMEAKAEAEKERKRKEDAMRFGLTKTITTSSFGDASNVATQKKTLLGQ